MIEEAMDIKKINNKEILLGDFLKDNLNSNTKLKILAANFTLDAFESLKNELEKIEELQFIFSSPNYLKEKNQEQYKEYKILQERREEELYGSKWKLTSRKSFMQKSIAKECANWIKEKVNFKSVISNEISLDKSIILENQEKDQNLAITGMKEFNIDELGYGKVEKIPRTRRVYPYPYSEEYLEEFNDLWDNDEYFMDVTDKVIQKMSIAFKDNSPEFLYYVTLYNIFKEFLSDINEDYQPNDEVGFKDTKIWKMLYPFQKDAVQSIITKLEKYNGCILADSVGLGKTFTALGVITYYLKRNKDVLILCPKKLENNWNQYTKNYKGNPFAEERLHYDVLYHTDLSRKTGESNGQNLERFNWENYDLIVIDESHNFRNGGATQSKKEQGKENRYDHLLNTAIKKGKQTKVLMLSATPVNNRFLDLKNQIALAYEGNSENLEKELNTTNSIDMIFKKAQTAYNEWTALPIEARTSEKLIEKLDFDFFSLLDSVTIARSRKHIHEFYNVKEIGDFPKRRLPENISPALTRNLDIDYHQIYKLLQELNLQIYQPMKYVYPSRIEKYESRGEGKLKSLTRTGREEGTKKLMEINLLKRLESSISSFHKTVLTILNKLNNVLQIISEYEVQRKGSVDGNFTKEQIEDIDSDDLLYSIGDEKSPIYLEDMDYISWRYELLKDKDIFEKLLHLIEKITIEEDEKLQSLYRLIDKKIENPINDNNYKILIFTAFSDTANYLYEHVSEYVQNKYNLHVGKVSGSDRLMSTLNIPNMTLNQIMCYFSPNSKNRDELYGENSPEIDILIATDVISEGQNLQDCDMVVNYDIHWNPVRIVQRFGRIDRIGSKNEEVQLVNFWPNVELDEYINLKERVEGRMEILNISATGDDNILSPDDLNEASYRKHQLEQMKNEVIDLEDINGGISIMDLGLEDYRLNVQHYIEQHSEIKKVPNGLYTVLPSNCDNPPGIIFALKNINKDCVDYSKNRLYPYYLIYVSDDEEIVADHTHTKELLSRLRMLCKDYPEPIQYLYQEFNHKTNNGMNMEHYSDLLEIAILSIMEKSDEQETELLFESEDFDLMMDDISGLEDFELISFFIVL